MDTVVDRALQIGLHRRQTRTGGEHQNVDAIECRVKIVAHPQFCRRGAYPIAHFAAAQFGRQIDRRRQT